MRQLQPLSVGLLVLGTLPVAASCSAVGEENEPGATSNDGDGSGGNGAGNSGGGGNDVNLGANGGSGGAGGVEECAAIAAEAKPALQAADIVWAVDTSGSMSDENAFVNDALDDFSQIIINSGIDVRVVMIGEEQFPLPFPFPGMDPPGICVDAPLGSGNCPDDTNLPTYLHVNEDVGSTDGLNVIMSTYSQWESMLRDGATKTLVVVTDDNATQAPYGTGDIDADADAFIADFTALNPGLLAGWRMSGIYSFTDCPDAASPGDTWGAIIQKTGGLAGDLCNQEFQPIFDDLAQQIIVASATLDCQYDIPAPPEGETLDPALVNVLYTNGGGAETPYGKVGSVSECDASLGGWYYDDNNNPGSIILCPASCDQAQSDPEGKIDILFGCETEVLIAN